MDLNLEPFSPTPAGLNPSPSPDPNYQSPDPSRAHHIQIEPQLVHGHGHGHVPHNGGTFGILAPAHIPEFPHGPPPRQILAAAGEDSAEVEVGEASVCLTGRVVVDPPNLDAWREKLFNVDDVIVLTDDEFQTYFPHVDNVYSHRSTQRYKRKPFISHYWDCRMKGRAPGTPKSDDPAKRKRKRVAREKNLCDVKIRITEYAPPYHLPSGAFLAEAADEEAAMREAIRAGIAQGHTQRLWTIQRVNGQGGNRKGVAGPHRHTLARSDEIKKNTVQRFLSKKEQEVRKAEKVVKRKPTGHALQTTKRHTRDHPFQFHAACFCPFSQRVWIALEAKKMAYQYIETDPFQSLPPSEPSANPQHTVPAIRRDGWSCAESGVILEYLEDLDYPVALLPADPQSRATCRFWVDHINAHIVPAFLALVAAPDPAATARLTQGISALTLAADPTGPLFLGPDHLSLVDVHIAPFALRCSRILAPLRGWAPALGEAGARWPRWVEALEGDVHVKATMSGNALYADTAGLLVKGATP